MTREEDNDKITNDVEANIRREEQHWKNFREKRDSNNRWAWVGLFLISAAAMLGLYKFKIEPALEKGAIGKHAKDLEEKAKEDIEPQKVEGNKFTDKVKSTTKQNSKAEWAK